MTLRRNHCHGGYCDRCDKPTRTIPLAQSHNEIENVCKDCLKHWDFEDRIDDDKKKVISNEELDQIVLDLGAVLHKHGINVAYNEDFNALRYTLTKEFLKDWLSYSGGDYGHYTKWFELKQTHPYYKHVEPPK